MSVCPAVSVLVSVCSGVSVSVSSGVCVSVLVSVCTGFCLPGVCVVVSVCLCVPLCRCRSRLSARHAGILTAVTKTTRMSPAPSVGLKLNLILG